MIESSSEERLEVIFDRAIEIENKAANIYREFSQLFSHIPEISVFWKRLTKDEKQHADILQDVRRSLSREQLLSPCDKEISEKVPGIQRFLSKDLTASIKNLDDAYELAHELEYSEVNDIFQFLAAEFAQYETRKQFVVSEITRHQQKLMDFGRNFGDRNRRREISIHAVQSGQPPS
jgi:rubrerythrin